MSNENQDLDDLLSGDEGDVQAEAPRAPEPETVAETGEKPSEAAPPAVATPPIESEPDLVPRKAILDERRKRQELERKIKEMEERLTARPVEPQPQPDWITDPETAARSLEEQMQLRLYQTAVYQSETIMRRQHEDYDDVAAVFAEAAREDPNLAMQVYRHPFPAEFAYQYGRKLKLMQEIGDDPEAYRAKLEAEIRAKLTGEPSTQAASRPVKSAPVPRSLARDVSQQPRNSRGQFDGPAPLEDILGD